MMSLETQDAVCDLQRQISKTVDLSTQDCTERAVDELLRHPERTIPSKHQRRNAMRHARHAAARRSKKRRFTSLEDPGQHETAINKVTAEPDSGYGVVEMMEWFNSTPCLRAADRILLGALINGEDAESLAAAAGIPVRRMRERISRARRRAWNGYLTEVVAA